MEPLQEAGKAEADPRSARMAAFVVFEIEGRRYALPVEQVREVLPSVEVDPLPGAGDAYLGVITLRGVLVPVVDLRRHLGIPPRPVGLRDHFLLAEQSGRRLVLPCDGVLGLQDLTREDDAGTSDLLRRGGRVALALRDTRGLVLVPALDELLTAAEAA